MANQPAVHLPTLLYENNSTEKKVFILKGTLKVRLKILSSD
jgi:hypothetical protein